MKLIIFPGDLSKISDSPKNKVAPHRMNVFSELYAFIVN